jgi:hypothetical protein
MVRGGTHVDAVTLEVAPTPPRHLDFGIAPERPTDLALTFPRRLEVIRELLGTLGEATRAGQDHLMHKLVTMLRGEVLEADLPLTGLEVVAVSDALTKLEHEAGRIAPTLVVFDDEARIVIAVLCRAWTDWPSAAWRAPAGL